MRGPVRFSHLKEMGKSPAHYLHAAQRDWTTNYLRKGTALHSYLLGGAEVVVYEEGVRRGKAWDAFQAKHPGKTILIPSEAAAVLGMRRAVESNDTAMRLLEGVRERQITWHIGERECSGTPDVVTAGSVVELKTTRSAQPERFVRDATRLGYAAQLTWYANGLRTARLADPQQMFIVAVESAEPFPVVVFELTRPAMEAGTKQWRAWWERLMVCEAIDHWPGYSDSIVPFDADVIDGDLIIDGAEMSLEEMGL